MKLIAQNQPGWELYDCERVNGAWTNLELIATHRKKKRKYSLGWNGKRLARSDAALVLEEYEPEALDWVVSVCRGLA